MVKADDGIVKSQLINVTVTATGSSVAAPDDTLVFTKLAWLMWNLTLFAGSIFTSTLIPTSRWKAQAMYTGNQRRI